MEVGIPQALSSLEKSFNSTSRLNIDGLKNSILDVSKLASQSKQLVELDLHNDKDDEGEIMLLAMILLQLHGVKLPTTESEEEDSDLLNKKKRQRTSPDQLAILEQIFQTDKMPNQQTRVHLADQLGMSSRRVQIWFQNKRAKVKRSVSRPDGECESPDSPSIESPSSPLSSSSDSSPIFSSSPAAAVAPFPLQHNASESATTLASPSIPTSLSVPFVFTSSTPVSPSPTTPTPVTTTTPSDLLTPIKFPQFSSTFVDNRPLLAASY